ncbi:Serine/threonine-protein phosphatase 1 regulatory subunit 10 [Penaeus vannamei]|uniref:Serine/threonine-protein phosphatase 1 regulatory subunit 10 n=1 Tax=Penaeus vannamei TaxID=6689 RepID=A0A423TCY6_PENVA|nr:Serine/threonine-protein phosphatase 1 regulatory subunit 10 [Penaeus vannamei]
MAKYSKKLVSKCIYLNILQATDIPFLDAFYEEGGWELVGAWLQEAVSSKNWPLAGQVLTLLDTSPMTVTRLKRTTTPKLVKELSRDCPSEDVQNTAKQLVHKWMEVVRQGDGTAAGVGLGNACAGDDDEERAEGAAAAPFQQEDATLVDLTSPDPEDEDKGETGPSQTPQAGSRESSLGEGGDASSSLDCQDESSNASTESDTTPAPTTPIRITIRSGSQVLAKVSSQRLSQDSTDSDDNKPLSVIKQEVEKARQARKALEAEKALAGAASTTSSTPAAAPTATTTTSLSAPAGDEAGADSTATTSPETNDVQPNGAEGATAEGAVVSGTTPTVHTIVTFTGGLSSKSSSSSKSEKEKSSRERHRSSSSSSKDKDKDRRDKDRSKSSSSRDKKSSSRDKEKERERSREKEKEREKERKNKEKQESEVKATLEKVKPHSADGLAKIPRKQASFLDALGSADSELNEAKKPSVKTYKSRGFRNTGLLDEPTKLPGVAGKKPAGAEKKGVVGGLAGGSALSPSGGLKRPSPLDDLASSQPDKRVRSSVSSSPLNADKPGGVKLISPKRRSGETDISLTWDFRVAGVGRPFTR